VNVTVVAGWLALALDVTSAVGVSVCFALDSPSVGQAVTRIAIAAAKAAMLDL